MNNQWDFEDTIEKIIEFRDQRNWKQFHFPKDLSAALSIEAAELQELFLWKRQEDSKEINLDEESMSNIQDEMADVAIYLFLLTNELGIDLKEAIRKKILKNEIKYPIIERT